MSDKRLEVFYHGHPVGVLVETSKKLVAFQYSDGWLKSGFPISPFALPLRTDVFVPKASTRDYSGGLFGVFADSLPDAWGQLLLHRYLLQNGIRELSSLDRLAYVGNAGMGALEYYPSKAGDFSLPEVDYDRLAAECKKILDLKPSEQLDLLYQMGGTSGGTRPKVMIEENGESWIIKFPAKEDPAISGKREYDYSLCAKACGIQMTKTDLIPSMLCDGYFKTSRFDRVGKEKIMAVTFAGLLDVDFRAPSCDYATYMKLVNILSRENKEQISQMYKTMCFNVLTHNLDDHTKNFSFLYDDRRGWHLAPAYDLTYSTTYFGEHTTAVNGKGKNIMDDDMIKVGVEGGLKKNACVDLLESIKCQVHNLEEYLHPTEIKRKKALNIRDYLGDISKTPQGINQKHIDRDNNEER